MEVDTSANLTHWELLAQKNLELATNHNGLDQPLKETVPREVNVFFAYCQNAPDVQLLIRPERLTVRPSGDFKVRRLILPICLSKSAASSAVARGMTPGSEKLVRNNELIVKRKSRPLMMGMTGLTRTAKKGQLKQDMIHKVIKHLQYKYFNKHVS